MQRFAKPATFLKLAARLRLHAFAYKLRNFLRTQTRSEPIREWTQTSLQDKRR